MRSDDQQVKHTTFTHEHTKENEAVSEQTDTQLVGQSVIQPLISVK